MENEIAEIVEALSASNMGGTSGALVDQEGFPRADIDVHTTRTLRHRLACLNTDHTALMGQIERSLWSLHAATASDAPQRPRAPPPVQPSAQHSIGETGTADAPMVTAMTNGHDPSEAAPFALVDGVAPEGPAAQAGLQVGDLIVRFGSVHADNHDGLRSLARLTQRSEGTSIPLLVLRGEESVQLVLVPRRWSGTGLLGFHINPI